MGKVIKVEEISHSSLGASSAYRWMACPASVRESKNAPKSTSSFYAAEGTIAHQVGEMCLVNGNDAADYVGDFYSTECEGDPKEFEVTEEMAEAVQVYADTVREIHNNLENSELKVEVRFNLDHIHKGLYGTNDACLIQPFGKLVIIDYKHGAGVPVDVKNNKQLMYYALGAGHELGYNFTEVEMVVVQPRAFHQEGGVRKFSRSAKDLVDWGVVLGEHARATEKADAAFDAGDHCKWCPALAGCDFKKNKINSDIMAAFEEKDTVVTVAAPEDMTGEQLASALNFADKIDMALDWQKSVRSYALKMAEKGIEIEGRKLSRGRAGNRKWRDEKEAEEGFLGEGFDKEDLLVPSKLKSPAQLDTVVGKESVAEHTTRSEGRLKLVPTASSSKAINAPLSAKSLFG